jgi:hypothetical protein
MMDRVLIDTLNLKSRDFATRWKAAIRNNPQLRHYNKMSDQELIAADIQFYPLLARTIDRGMDRSLVGNFFVNLGKGRMKAGFPKIGRAHV